MRSGPGGASLPRGGWIARIPWNAIVGSVLLVVTGVVLGSQYLQPNLRVLSVLLGIVVFGIAWRLDMVTGIGVLIMALPYPKNTTFGSTNLALILLLLIIWLLRASQSQSPGLSRTRIDVPILGLLISYAVSFYNISNPSYVAPALQNTGLMVTGVLMFYLVVSNVRSERALMRLHGFQIASLVAMCLLAYYEVTHPGAVIVPGWIEFRSTGEVFETRNVRVGGPFFDYELLSEFCATNILFILMWLVRSRSVAMRVLFGGILLLTIFTLFTTVTRGSIVSLALALGYLTWIMRRHLRVVPFTIISASVIGGFFAMNFYVANFTRSGSVLSRFQKTEFHGLVPETRVDVWQMGWERFLQHPILGHGPYYSHQEGTTTYLWPHNGYLYIANLVGVVGLAFFLGILVLLWRATRPDTDRLDEPSYARSYLLIAHVQLALFLIDQTKIDFLRNTNYVFQVWLMFASMIAASHLVHGTRPAASGARPAPLLVRAR